MAKLVDYSLAEKIKCPVCGVQLFHCRTCYSMRCLCRAQSPAGFLHWSPDGKRYLRRLDEWIGFASNIEPIYDAAHPMRE